MAWQFMNSTTQGDFIRRVEGIKSDSQRQFGVLTAAGVLAHLSCAVKVSLREHPVKDGSNFFTRVIFRRVAFESPFPWPKGKIKAPDGVMPEPGEIELERAGTIDAIKRFVALSEREPEKLVPHPFFGPTTLRYYQRIHGKHFEHHLGQFGV